jgi:hypothetical protein
MRFDHDPLSAFDAHFAAERLAFGPLIFQAVRLLRESGLLELAKRKGDAGLAEAEAIEATQLSSYAVRVLLEGGLAGDVLALRDERYLLTKTGLAVLMDPMVRANFDFVHDVCYLGAFELEASLREGRAAGLASIAPAATATTTVYEALATLSDQVRRSWFAFDHFYSDRSFRAVLPRILAREPERLLDVGGNTGRFALFCLAASPRLRVTIADLPGQLADARANAVTAGVDERLTLAPIDLRDASAPLPRGADALWMSQLLSCFPPEEAAHILRRAADAMEPESRLYVLETFWDRQRVPVARFCLQATSLYFACIANGTSKMHRAGDLLPLLDAAGLVLEEDLDGIGAAHTLWVCRKK